MRIILIFFFVLVIGCNFSLAQQNKVDSLTIALNNHPAEDSTRLKLLLLLAKSIVYSDFNRCMALTDEAIRIAQNTDNKKRQVEALNLQMGTLKIHDNAVAALPKLKEALKICSIIHDTLRMAMLIGNLGTFYYDNQNYDSAIYCFRKSLEFDSIKGMKNSGNKFLKLGMAYKTMGNYTSALRYLLKSLEVQPKNISTPELVETYARIGDLYDIMDDCEKSLEFLEKALTLAVKLEDPYYLAHVKSLLANTYINCRIEKDKALQYLLEARQEFENIGILYNEIRTLIDIANTVNKLSQTEFIEKNKNGVFDGLGLKCGSANELSLAILNKCFSLRLDTIDFTLYSYACYVIGIAYLSAGDYNQALDYSYKSLQLNINEKNCRGRILQLLVISDIYEKMGRYDSAFIYFRKYFELNDSILNSKKREEMALTEVRHEFITREKELNWQKQLSEKDAQNTRELLQGQLLLARTREQEFQLKSKELELSKRDKDISHLAYLKKMAELNIVQLAKKDKEKQLSLKEKENALQRMSLGTRSIQRNILFFGTILSLITLFFIFRNYYNQRKSNVQLKQLNTELSSTLQHLEQTQEQLIITEKQKETETIRRRISQDIHDDISSGLTRIAWLTELVRESADPAVSQDVNTMLENINSSSRETIDRLGEIIWAINPDKDNLEGFFAYVRTYLVNFFEGKPSKIKLDFPDEKLNVKFNPDLKRTLFLVIKEAAHNIVKHAGAKNVNISFHCEGDLYSISIEDDGSGFDPSQVSQRSNGLKNMQQRIENVGGTFLLDTAKRKGTRISLEGEIFA